MNVFTFTDAVEALRLLAGEKRTVRLSAEDYVCSRAGSRRQDYDPQVADRSQVSFSTVCRDLHEMAAARHITDASLDQLLAMVREIMRVRYDREIVRTRVATA